VHEERRATPARGRPRPPRAVGRAGAVVLVEKTPAVAGHRARIVALDPALEREGDEAVELVVVDELLGAAAVGAEAHGAAAGGRSRVAAGEAAIGRIARDARARRSVRVDRDAVDVAEARRGRIGFGRRRLGSGLVEQEVAPPPRPSGAALDAMPKLSSPAPDGERAPELVAELPGVVDRIRALVPRLDAVGGELGRKARGACDGDDDRGEKPGEQSRVGRAAGSGGNPVRAR
jgi:hypothetical protein